MLVKTPEHSLCLKSLLPPNTGLKQNIVTQIIGWLDFMLPRALSNTLGSLASGVTDIRAGTDVERRYLISSWNRLSS